MAEKTDPYLNVNPDRISLFVELLQKEGDEWM